MNSQQDIPWHSKPINQLLALIAIVFFAYIGSLSNGFFWLDHYQILNEQTMIINSWEEFKQVFLSNDKNYTGYHRPLYNLFFTMDMSLWGKNASMHHFTSLLLHLINVVLVYKLLVKMSGKNYAATFGALLWGILPVTASVVSIIHGKTGLLVSLFILANLLASFKAFEAKDSLNRIKWTVLAVLFLFLGVLSKEFAILAPVLFGISLFVQRRQQLFQWKKPAILFFGASFLIVISYVLFRVSIGSVENEHPLSTIDRLLTFIPVYVDYILKSFTSIELTTSDATMIWSEISGLAYSIYALLFLAILYLQYRIVRLGGLAATAILWFNLLLLPVCQLFPTLHFRADRYLYFPSLALMIAVVFSIVQLSEKKAFWDKNKFKIQASLAAILVIFFIRLFDRNKDFDTNVTAFEPVVEAHPECREAQSILAREYFNQFSQSIIQQRYERTGPLSKKTDQAFQAAFKENPKYLSYVDITQIQAMYGLFLYRNQNFPKAFELLDRLVIEKGNFSTEVYFNHALAARKVKEFEKAYESFKIYLKSAPKNASALFLMADVCYTINKIDEGLQYDRSYLNYFPNAQDRKDVEKRMQLMQQ